MVFSAIDFLDKWIKPCHTVFEWGSGGSTLFFRERAKRVVSIEHDEEFYGKTLDSMPDINGLHTRKIIPPDMLVPNDNNNKFLSSVVPGMSFENYASEINNYEDGSIDLICVDGRARTECFVLALTKLRKGGLLVLDNSERIRYQSCFDAVLGKWQYKKFAGAGPYNDYFWESTIFTLI